LKNSGAERDSERCIEIRRLTAGLASEQEIQLILKSQTAEHNLRGETGVAG
jgi:hypothetical protein